MGGRDEVRGEEMSDDGDGLDRRRGERGRRWGFSVCVCSFVRRY